MGLFKHAFQELLTRHLMGNEAYEAEDVKEQLSTFQSFVVKVDDVKGWLSSIHQGENQQRVDNPSLRVMLGSSLIKKKGEYTGRGVGMGDAKPKPTRPFLRDDYDLLEQAFLLPKATMIPLTGEPGPLRGHFDVYQGLREDGKPIFGFVMQTFSSLLVGLKANVFLSFDPLIGATNALVLCACEPPGEFGWLEEDLRHLAPLARNPFLLPTIISQRVAEAIWTSLDRKFDELHDLEISSGQTGIGMTGAKQLGRCDDPQLPLAILGVAQVAMAIESYIKGHLLTVESMCKELEAFPHLLPESERARTREHNDLIAQHLDWIKHTLKAAQIRVDHLKQRADAQATAINSLLAQRNNETNRIMVMASTRIAEDTRRDSSAMKSIALLTFLFLPATFTATYFGTPAVVAIEPSQGVYWAVTLPLTAVVVLAWLTFFYGWVMNRLPLSKEFKSVL